MSNRAIPHHVKAAMDRGRASVHAAASAVQPSAAAKRARRGVMNKTEAHYALELEARKRNGELAWYGFESMTLRIANGAKYTPDFALLTATGRLEFHEVKGGFIREAALVRLKVAASLYPFAFVLVQFKRGQSTKREIAA